MHQECLRRRRKKGMGHFPLKSQPGKAKELPETDRRNKEASGSPR